MEALTSYEFPVRTYRNGSKYDVIKNDVIYRVQRGDDLFPVDPEITAKKIKDRFNAVAFKRKCSFKSAIESENSIVVQFVTRTEETV